MVDCPAVDSPKSYTNVLCKMKSVDTQMLAERQLFVATTKPRASNSCRDMLCCTMFLEQSVKSFLLSNLESAGLDARMVYTQ